MVDKPRCPKCDSSQVYNRLKEGDWRCFKCGYIGDILYG